MSGARDWAARIMALVGDTDLPLYGSDAWEAAPIPVQLASAVRAAESWRRESDPFVIAARLDVELESARCRDEEDTALWREAAGLVVRIATGPTYDELAARRRQIVRPAPAGAPTTLAWAVGDSQ